MKSLADHLREIPSDLKQFAKNCWYAPLWLKITNGLWLSIFVALLWGGTYWMVNTIETADPQPHTLEGNLLGMLFMLFPLIMVAIIFTLRFAYEWIATKILVRFGFIESKE